MKRILSVLLALVMVIGMLPMTLLTASAAEVSETLTLAGSTGTVSGESISWTSGNLSFTANKNTSSNAIRTDDTDHFRLYIGFSATLTCSAGNITKIVMTATGTSYAVAPTGSDGSVGTVSGTTITIVPNEASNTYTIPSISKQTRIKTITVTYATVDSADCAHTNVETIEAVAATCTTAGNTEGTKCADCGIILSGNETIAALGHTNDAGVVTAPTCTTDGYTLYTCTVCGSTKKDNWVDATGHTYVDGTCSACGIAKPVGLDGKYYIAAIRKTGNYWYMTSTKDIDNNGNEKDRFVAVDSGLTVLPESITDIVDAQVFELVTSGDGYTIKFGDQYLGWSSDNTVILTTEARVLTVEANGTAYKFHFTVSDTEERYLELNSTSGNDYFAFYKGTQISDLYLIPVVEATEDPTDPELPVDPTDPPACEHANTTYETVDPTCTEGGYEKTICSDCGEVINTEVWEATGHNYVDGICVNCNEPDPTTSNGQYTLVTDVTSLAAGDKIVIVASGSNYALSTEQKNNNRGQIAITKDGNVIEINSSVQVLTLDAGTVSNTWAFNTGSGYLYAASSGSNYLRTQTTNDANGSWKIEISTAGVATIKAQGANTRNWLRYNSSSSLFSCYSSGQADVSIYKYTIVDGCVHEVADDAWTVVTEATCETAGSKTGTCSKCGETVEKEIPALGHAYSYNAEVGKMVCANCGDAFMNTIAEAKAYTDTNKVYYFKGIVTYVSGKTVYVQDDTAGVCVYFTNADNAAGIAAGDELLVWDTMTTYGGLIETTYTTSAEIQILSSGNELPAAQSATLTELLANPSKYQGSRVTISGMTMGKINTSGNTVMTAAEGGTINLYQAKGMADNVTENDIVDITVVFSIYSNAYQLLLNQSTATTDVVVTTEGVPSDLALSDISAAKAGTEGAFFKVKGIVTFVDGASVYMQDATGGIVARLASGVTAPAIGTEIEAIGAYTTYNGLIQLEGATFTEISADNTVAAKETTVADLLAGAATNALLSEKVSLKNVTVKTVGGYNATYKNLDYTVVDENGNEIKLYRTPLADEANKLVVGDVIDVIGVVTTYNGYQLRVVNESDITIAPSIELTYISLNPAKDALGFKAIIKGDLPADAKVGIIMSVAGGLEKTYLVSIADLKTDGVVSLCLKGIMACNGGEMKITGTPVIVIGEETISGISVETSMKDTIKAVNAITDLTAEQQAAVGAYYEKYQSVMSTWFAADETNNIVAWIPTTEETTPAE